MLVLALLRLLRPLGLGSSCNKNASETNVEQVQECLSGCCSLLALCKRLVPPKLSNTPRPMAGCMHWILVVSHPERRHARMCAACARPEGLGPVCVEEDTD